MKLTTLFAILSLSCLRATELSSTEWNHVLTFAKVCSLTKSEDIPPLLKEAILKSDARPDVVAKLVEVAIHEHVTDQNHINTVVRWAVAVAPDAYKEVKAVAEIYEWENDDLFKAMKGAKVVIEKQSPNPLDRPYWRIPRFQYEMLPLPDDPPVTKIGN